MFRRLACLVALMALAMPAAIAGAARERPPKVRVTLVSPDLNGLRKSGRLTVRIALTRARSAMVSATGRQRLTAARKPESLMLARPRRVRAGRSALVLSRAGRAALGRCADLDIRVRAVAGRSRDSASRTIGIHCERGRELVAVPLPEAPNPRSAPAFPAAAGKGPDPEDPPSTPAAYNPSLAVSGAAIEDGGGGEVLLRGGALIRKSAPGFPTVEKRDWENMHALGWNSVRLGFAWGRLMPERGKVDAAYADAIAGVAREAAANGFYVVLDSHQDVWGAPHGFNGAPAWAEYDTCKGSHVDLAGATGAFAANYLSPWTICQFSRFWEDADARKLYADALGELAKRVADEPLVAGFDLMNEPFQGLHANGEFENRLLYPFYSELSAALRRHDSGAIAFEEPSNSKNVHLPTSPDLTRAVLGAREGAVYAPHVYGLWDANDAFTEREPFVQANMDLSAREASVMDAPLWYGEFGMRRGVPGGDDTLGQIYDIADTQLAGAAMWEYLDPNYGPVDASGRIAADRQKAFSRAYPGRTHGTLRSFGFDRSSGRFEIEWTSAGEDRGTFLFVPAVHFPKGIEIDAGPGITVAPVEGTQYLEVRAARGDHRLALAPTP